MNNHKQSSTFLTQEDFIALKRDYGKVINFFVVKNNKKQHYKNYNAIKLLEQYELLDYCPVFDDMFITDLSNIRDNVDDDKEIVIIRSSLFSSVYVAIGILRVNLFQRFTFHNVAISDLILDTRVLDIYVSYEINNINEIKNDGIFII